MSASMEIEFVKPGQSIISKYNYPYIKDINPTWAAHTGFKLPRGLGFSTKHRSPRVFFKVYKAMADKGLHPLANYILSKSIRSLITRNYIWDSVGKFAQPVPHNLQSAAYFQSLEKLRTSLDIHKKIDPIPLHEAVAGIPRDASPGLPYLQTNPEYKRGDILTTELPKIAEDWERVAKGDDIVFPDSAAFARSHIRSPDSSNTVDPVFAVPISIMLQEARFTIPLTNEFNEQRCCLNTAYGCEIMKGGMMWLNNQLVFCNRKHGAIKIFMSYYSEFDSSVPAWLIRDILSIVMEKFNLTDDDKIKFCKCINYFINTPIQNSDGRRFQKDHGILTGSMFTQLIATFVNMVVTWCVSTTAYGEVPVMDIFFHEDSVLCYRSNVIMDIAQYAKYMKESFGMIINVQKSYSTSNLQNVQFLGYFNNNGAPFKDPDDSIAELLLPQHLIDTWEYCIGRSLGCLLASAGCSSHVFEVCQAVYTRACHAKADIQSGIDLIKTRSIAMGVEDLALSKEFFLNESLSTPRPLCAKFTFGVHIWNQTPYIEVPIAEM